MKLAIGIDLGGTKILGIVMDEKGRIHKSYERPTEAHKSRQKILSNIVEVIKKLELPGICGVGMGIPGFAVDGKMVFGGGTLGKLVGINIKKEIEKRIKFKVFLENDANCFALAEHRFGAAKECSNSIGIIWGTGVGSGIIINNKIYSGTLGGAGETGHTKLVINGEIKEVEDLISGPNIVKRYEELSGKKAHMPTVILNQKDKVARKLYQEVVLYTGLFFSNLIHTFNPDCIVVGGGVSNLPIYKDIRKIVNKYTIPSMAKACKIKKHSISDDAGVIGAAQLVFCN
ncbi:MAG: ROK family protein [Nanoarchaeota archaeon]|nr:ROK family protein [Nanoarchaeota archaeon]MBU1320768.1 ROK family protein [Nanoarchaeota archaeon]MBU1598135.1 ROK family protein [Nanoarchaeota archaeon]MBU2441973.1 ROK family protein [Nanoarchaeota archaeon]